MPNTIFYVIIKENTEDHETMMTLRQQGLTVPGISMLSVEDSIVMKSFRSSRAFLMFSS